MNYGSSCHVPAAQALRRNLVVLALLIQQPVIKYGAVLVMSCITTQC